MSKFYLKRMLMCKFEETIKKARLKIQEKEVKQARINASELSKEIERTGAAKLQMIAWEQK